MSRDACADPGLHRERRQRLLNELGDGFLLLRTAREQLRNGDVHQEFRPDSDFLRLTGFPEPEAVLLAWRAGRRDHRSVLFVRDRDPAREVWDGRRHGPAGALRHFGVDQAESITKFWPRLAELVPNSARLFHRLGADADFDRRLLAAFATRQQQQRRRAGAAHPVIQDPWPQLAAQRVVKDATEIAALRSAAAATVAGHVAAMRGARAGMHEFELQALLEAEFRRAGSPRNGYASIVASGPNACILHYHDNDRRVRAGELVLIDAGAEVGGCTADVTRTFPVDGVFTPAQAAVYAAVLRAQVAGIRACRVGAPWDAAHRACIRSLTRALVMLGVLRGDIRKLVAKGAFRPWYMHGSSHWLGRDVHDAGAYERSDGSAVPLSAGAVLTVEPGLYFAPGDKRVPRELRGIGVRIEDDVLVARHGPVVLTEAVPKAVTAIERLMSGRR